LHSYWDGGSNSKKKIVCKLRYVGVPDAIVVTQEGECQLPDEVLLLTASTMHPYFA